MIFIKTLVLSVTHTENCIHQFPCVCFCVCMCVWLLLLPNHWTDLHKNYTSR